AGPVYDGEVGGPLARADDLREARELRVVVRVRRVGHPALRGLGGDLDLEAARALVALLARDAARVRDGDVVPLGVVGGHGGQALAGEESHLRPDLGLPALLGVAGTDHLGGGRGERRARGDVEGEVWPGQEDDAAHRVDLRVVPTRARRRVVVADRV